MFSVQGQAVSERKLPCVYFISKWFIIFIDICCTVYRNWLFCFQIKASNKTDDVQTEILRGERAFKAVLNRTVQWDIEYALQQLRVAQTSVLDVDRLHETRTLSGLLQAQLAEIKRLVSVLRGLHAETCTLSTTAQVNRIVSNSKYTERAAPRRFTVSLTFQCAEKAHSFS